MNTKTVPEIIGDLKDIYRDYFGVPHSNKAYTEQSKSIKALTNSVGYENLIENFKHLLLCEEAWIQNSKNIPGLIKFFDAIQTMRLNSSRVQRTGSYGDKIAHQNEQIQIRLAQYRKEILSE
jgi:hypothetical protein